MPISGGSCRCFFTIQTGICLNSPHGWIEPTQGLRPFRKSRLPFGVYMDPPKIMSGESAYTRACHGGPCLVSIFGRIFTPSRASAADADVPLRTSLCGGAWETAVLLNEDDSVRCFRGGCHDHDSDGDSESARLPRSLEWQPAIGSGPGLLTGATGAGGL